MYLKEIDLEYICNHKRFHAKLGPGMIGIIGPNGSGKSNILQSVYGAWTNDFSWHPNGKKGIRSLGAPADKLSRISVLTAMDSGDFRVVREVGPSTVNLLEKGDARFESAEEIKVQIETIMDAPIDIIRNYIFVEQWEMFRFLVAQPAIRAAFLSSICSTDRADDIWKAAGLLKSQDEKEDRSDWLGGEIKVAGETLQQARRDLGEKERALVVAQASLPLDTGLAAAAGVRERANVGREAAASYDAVCQNYTAAEGKLQAIRERHARFSQRLAELQTDQKTLIDQLAKAETRKDELTTKALLERERRGLQRSIEDVQTAHRTAQANLEKATKALNDLGDLKADQMDAYNIRSYELSNALLVFNSETGTCPTCGAEGGDVAHRLQVVDAETATEELHQVSQQATDLQKKLDRHLQLTEKSRAFKQEALRTKVLLDQKRKELETLGPGALGIDQLQQEALTACRTLRETRDKTAAEISTVQTAALNTAAGVERAEAAFETIRVQKAKLAKALEGRPTDAEVLAANALLDSAELLGREIDGLQAVVRHLRMTIQDHETTLTRLRAEYEEQSTLRGWLTQLEDIRTVFHRDALPRDTMAATLGELVDNVNQSLSEFQAPFRITIRDEETDFIAIFPDGPMPAKGLSGAQKVLLALAIRLSVGFGFLALDEPTAGLDRKNISQMCDILFRLRERVRGAGGQVIVVTHEQEMMRVFDQVIQLNA